MTPLNTKEQFLLAGLLGVFVLGSAVLAWQQKHMDRQLAGFLSVGPAEAQGAMAKSSHSPRNGHKDAKIISLSHADAEALEELPGIGPRLAEEIIRYRQASPFVSVEDLMKVPGIGPKKFQKIKDRVKVN